LTLILEGHEGHSQHITAYVDSKLKIGHGKTAEGIRSQLQAKASGVFMWVVLVVDILNREHERGQTHRLRKRLQDLSPGLPELFRDILTRESLDRNQLLLCVQWVLFAHHPLTPEQLYFAILSGIGAEELLSAHSDEITAEDIRRFILHSSNGLAEITKSKTPTVQFIRESVRDFFLKENGVSTLWERLIKDFPGQSHDILKQCCLKYMSIDTAHALLNELQPKASSQEAEILRQSALKSFPFLEYAVHQVLYYSNAAEGGGITQQQFILDFQLTKWIELNNVFEKREVRRYTTQASFLYISAERNMPHLIVIHPRNLAYLDIEDEWYGVPLFAALATESREAFEKFLSIEVTNQSIPNMLDELYHRICEEQNKWSIFGRTFEFSRRKSILVSVLAKNNETLVLFLLNTGKVDVNMKDPVHGQTPLSWAAEKWARSRCPVTARDGSGRG
jgi:hypothetical protein